MDIKKLQALVVDALEDVKAQDIHIYDTTHLTSMFDRIAVASGTSNRQTKALAASVRDKVKAAGGHIVNMEGETTGEWVLVDLGDMVVHIMQPAIRAYYRLEELWGDKEIRLADARRGTDARKPSTKKTTESKSTAGDSKTAAKKTAKKTPKTVASTAGKVPTAPAARTSKTASKVPAKTAKKTTASKTAAKSAAKPAGKSAGKSAAKSATRPPARSPSKSPSKSPAKTAAKKAAPRRSTTKG
jgi:ribosome-associated protein